jgi:signal transduction histidine kinase
MCRFFLQHHWEENTMSVRARALVAYALAFAAGAAIFANAALALGPAADAKAMLDKTAAALKADKAKTLDEINAGTNGFLVGDIYPFCFNLSDGILVAVANPNAKANLGKDIRTNKDATGDAFGERLYAAAKAGGGEVNYVFPKPGPDKTPAAKVSFVAAVADLGCGVGYYK